MRVSFPTWDHQLFMYLNSKHTPMLDPIMLVLSSGISWLVVFCIALALLIYKNRDWGKRAVCFMIVGLVSNSLVNTIVKYIVMRPRPSNSPLIQDVVHQLSQGDNSYSFFSAHSSNSFCLAVFVALYLKNKLYGTLFIIWASVVAYSRIYLGRHYPLDVICGILFGLLTGMLAYWFYQNNVTKQINQVASENNTH